MNTSTTSQKSKSFCLVLAIVGNILFIGGLHRLYAKKYLSGILMFFTLGGFAIWTLIDVLFLLCNRFKDGNNKTVRTWVL
ncbi:MAG: TM2 domain-containing protein [Pseudomonadota bacterium]|nr:TM2 domain-containing protein [Pseudomonadota bacterium]